MGPPSRSCPAGCAHSRTLRLAFRATDNGRSLWVIFPVSAYPTGHFGNERSGTDFWEREWLGRLSARSRGLLSRYGFLMGKPRPSRSSFLFEEARLTYPAFAGKERKGNTGVYQSHGYDIFRKCQRLSLIRHRSRGGDLPPPPGPCGCWSHGQARWDGSGCTRALQPAIRRVTVSGAAWFKVLPRLGLSRHSDLQLFT